MSLSTMGHQGKEMDRKRDYHEFYTPPPINKGSPPHNNIPSPTVTQGTSSLLVHNKNKVKAARLMTFSKLLQYKIKSSLKLLKLAGENCSLTTMFNSSDSGYGSSGACDFVTASGLENPDHVGWLMDLSSSKLRWCVVADMLFCIFENDFAEDPLNVLVLPGFKVKSLVYNSAKRATIDSSDIDGNDKDKIDSKTVSGMLRFQFVLQNPSLDKSYAFGMDNKTDLEIWMSVLRTAVNLDTDLYEEDSDSENDRDSLIASETSSDIVGSGDKNHNTQAKSKHMSVGSSSTSHSAASSGSSECLLNCTSKSLDMLLSQSSDKAASLQCLTSTSLESSELQGYFPSMSKTRKSCMSDVPDNNNSGETNNSDSKVPAFVKVVRNSSFNDASKTMEHKKPFRKLSSVDDFRQKLRINGKHSNDKKLIPFQKAQSTDNIFGALNSNENLSHESHNNVTNGNTVNDKKTRHNNSKLKKSNSFKDFFVKKSKQATTTLSSVINPVIQGHLNLKHRHKWAKYWCVICQDCMLHAFKSQDCDTVAEVTLNLKDCKLELVERDKSKLLYTLKLTSCNTDNKSLSFSMDTLREYCQWLEVIKQKTSSETSNSNNKQTSKTEKVKEKSLKSNKPHDGSNYSMTNEMKGTTKGNLAEFLRQHRNTSNFQTNRSPQSGRKTSVVTFNSSGTHLPVNENVLQRIKNQRKFSVPTLPSYNEIIQQATENQQNEKSSKSSPKKSHSHWRKLLPKVRLHRKSSSESQSGETESEKPAGVNNLRETGLKKAGSKKSSKSHDANVLKRQSSNDETAAPSCRDQDTSIFNTHLPGPNNEGLLLVKDDVKATSPKPILRAEHYRSYSDGSINVIGLDNENRIACDTGNRQRAAVVLNVAAREVDSPSAQGYLDRKMEDSEDWVNIWGVLKEDTLYVYSQPIDECTMDALTVSDWEVGQTDVISNKPNVLMFKHKVYENQYFSSDCPSDFQQWTRELQKPRAAMGNNDDVSMEDLNQQKNELLKYVLSQRKQALKSLQARRASSTTDNGSQGTNNSSSEMTDKQDEDFIMVDDDQNWKDMTQMMQRKVSMQLKLDTLQKSLMLQNKKTPTKRKFKLPFNKGSKINEEPQVAVPMNDNIVKQVKDLNYKITSLQVDIDEKKQMMGTDNSPAELFTMGLPANKTTEEKSKFKLHKKFTVSKLKNSFSTADTKTRDTNVSTKLNKTKHSASLRHTWSPDVFRNNMKDEDLSPTSLESSSSSSPDHKLSRLSLYSKRNPSPRGRYMTSIRDLESPQEEHEGLNMSQSSSNDASYDTSLSKNGSSSSILDTPMKDIVYRNKNRYQHSVVNDNQQGCTSNSSTEDTISSDMELDCVNGNRRNSISKETMAKIEEFEEYIKSRLGNLNQ